MFLFNYRFVSEMRMRRDRTAKSYSTFKITKSKPKYVRRMHRCKQQLVLVQSMVECLKLTASMLQHKSSFFEQPPHPPSNSFQIFDPWAGRRPTLCLPARGIHCHALCVLTLSLQCAWVFCNLHVYYARFVSTTFTRYFYLIQ